MGIVVAMELARQLVKRTGRAQPPSVFDDIEAKIRVAFEHHDEETINAIMLDAIGDVTWLH
jgi:hypothetical protein